MEDELKPQSATGHEPIFNIPMIVLVFLVLMWAIELVSSTLLSPNAVQSLFLNGAFIPARYSYPPAEQGLAYYWSFVSYSLLHGGFTHLAINSFWLAAFGSLVARRIGAVRFVLLWIVTSIAGAALFLALNWGASIVMVGASGAVSGLMGAAARFGIAGRVSTSRANTHLMARLSFREVLSSRSVLVFLAVWFGINGLMAFGVSPGSAGMAVAWEAHIGGFLVGFLGFALFDPPQARSISDH